MNGFFQSRGFKVLTVVVVLLLTVMIYTESKGTSIIADALGFVTSPLATVGTAAVEDTKKLLPEESSEDLRKQIAQLEEENRIYREMLVDYYDIKTKFSEYEAALEIKEENKDFVMVSGSVIGKDATENFYGFMIDQGYLSGIEKGDPVITSKGLIGWISKVYATTSFVTTILSDETQIGVASEAKNEMGVISGNIKLADDGLVKLSYLDNETKISSGDIISTTGLGGNFPKKLIIGEVVEVKDEEFSVTKYAVVKPYEDIKNISEVFVITDFYGKGLTAAED